MELIADILLIAGALGAAFYCFILSRRLNRFTNLENGMGGAIAVLSAQVDDMTRTLERAQTQAGGSDASLLALTSRAEEVAGRLELLVAAMHDLPEAPAHAAPDTPAPGPATIPTTATAAAGDDRQPDAPGTLRHPALAPADAAAQPPGDIFRSRRSRSREAAE